MLLCPTQLENSHNKPSAFITALPTVTRHPEFQLAVHNSHFANAFWKAENVF